MNRMSSRAWIASLAAALAMIGTAWARTEGTDDQPQAPAAAPAPAAPAAPAARPAPARPAASAVHRVSPFRQTRMTEAARTRYIAQWGVDRLKVSYTSSGNLIRFTYRVVDAQRAKVLNAKQFVPSLYGQRSRATLQVPVMEKIGQLRQSGTPIVGQEYWMAFSNKGNYVKPGDRVNITIGTFRADGLVVE